MKIHSLTVQVIKGGQFFYKHPTGRAFYNFFGENIFRADLCNADVKLGDLLIHEGYAYDAQAHAAKVYNADKTLFCIEWYIFCE